MSIAIRGVIAFGFLIVLLVAYPYLLAWSDRRATRTKGPRA